MNELELVLLAYYQDWIWDDRPPTPEASAGWLIRLWGSAPAALSHTLALSDPFFVAMRGLLAECA